MAPFLVNFVVSHFVFLAEMQNTSLCNILDNLLIIWKKCDALQQKLQ